MKRSGWVARAVGVGLVGFGAALAAGLAAVLAAGWGYYRLDALGREAHPLHGALASGAGGGVALGLLGTALMLAMLAYSLRKRFSPSSWLGPVPLWLRFHVICGVAGPLFIALHGGLRWPTGLIAVGFWCMVLVALSGVFGRYVYGFLPRVHGGRALAWDEAMASLADQRAALVGATAGSRTHAVGEAMSLARDLELEASTLFDLARLDREVRRRRRRARALLAGAELPASSRAAALALVDDQLRLKRGLEAARVAYRMFRYWHLFHRPLASAMYVIVALHVLFAVLIGGSLSHLAQWVGALASGG